MGRSGFEPLKAYSQQIYSLPRLAASVPTRTRCPSLALEFQVRSFMSRACYPVTAAGGMLYRARESGVQVEFVRAKAQHCCVTVLPDLHRETELRSIDEVSAANLDPIDWVRIAVGR